MAAFVIYAVVEIPIDVNSKICNTNVTDPSVYHCGNKESGDHSTCPTGNWCFAKYSGVGTLNCSCVPAVDLPAVQGSKPNPYNWMADLVDIPIGTTGPSVTLPSVNGNLPHNLQTNISTILDNSFVAYADQTSITLDSNDNLGYGYLIVAYDSSWFQTQEDVNNFTSNPIWLNYYDTTTYTYNGITIPTFPSQFANIPSGGTNPIPPTPPPAAPAKSSHSYLILILVAIVAIAIVIFIIAIVVYNKKKNKKKNK